MECHLRLRASNGVHLSPRNSSLCIFGRRSTVMPRSNNRPFRPFVRANPCVGVRRGAGSGPGTLYKSRGANRRDRGAKSGSIDRIHLYSADTLRPDRRTGNARFASPSLIRTSSRYSGRAYDLDIYQLLWSGRDTVTSGQMLRMYSGFSSRCDISRQKAETLASAQGLPRTGGPQFSTLAMPMPLIRPCRKDAP